MTAEGGLAPADARRGPLHHHADRLARTGGPGTVRLTELAFRTLVDVRAGADGDAVGRLESALGVALPRRAGRATRSGARDALWLGPGWWLVGDEPDPAVALEPELVGALRRAAAGAASVVDVSAQYTTLRLAGPHARAVLEHGCWIDLHPRAFPPGSCARTTLAKAQVVLHHTAPDEHRILVGASYADYLARWLLDAMSEYTAETPAAPAG